MISPIHMTIDNREHELIAKCNLLLSANPKFTNKIVIRVQPLDIGDVMIHDPILKEKSCIIFERKALSDFMSSLQDGRYNEQSHRLDQIKNIHNHNIIYIIEGDLYTFNSFSFASHHSSSSASSSFHGKKTQDKTVIYNAMFSILYYKGFSVVRTFHQDETCQVLLCACLKLYNNQTDTRPKLPYYQVTSATTSSATDEEQEENEQKDEQKDDAGYLQVVKCAKKDSVTSGNITAIMLMQVPKVGASLAMAVTERFKTMTDLIIALQEDATCLNDVVDGNGKKLSKPAIKNIVEMLGI